MFPTLGKKSVGTHLGASRSRTCIDMKSCNRLPLLLALLSGLTFIATVYLGWHYVVDDVAGLAMGAIAVILARLLTGFDPRPDEAPSGSAEPATST